MTKPSGGVVLPARALNASGSSSRTSLWARVTSLFRKRRWSVVVLVIVSILSGFTESAILAILAESAATIGTGANRAHIHIGPLHVHPGLDTVLGVALVLVIVRLALQIPLSVLPPRIASLTQATVRMRLFHAFSRASWDVQARDREGQLQETMTGQVGQVTVAVLNVIGLITSTLLLSVMLISALVLNAIAAAFVLVLTVCMFGLLRPLRRAGRRRARALSSAQVEYARGIAESIRVAEETQVFAAGDAQRRWIGGLVESMRRDTIATQVLLRLAANLYATVIILLFVSSLFLLYEIGKGHAASLG